MKMLPIVDRLETQFAERMAFITLDAEDPKVGQDLMRALRVGGHPSFVIMRPDGTEVRRHWGTLTETALLNELDLALAG
ncbi:MAG: hypothetical protein R3E39_22240 [Anaerolineae bacterium]